jgi:hypothetical protein
MHEIMMKPKKNQKDWRGKRPVERNMISLMISKMLKTKVMKTIFLMMKILSCIDCSIYSISLF